MFERFTAQARRVIFFSRYEAIEFASPYVEPEHLLLGLLREGREWVKTLTTADLDAAMRAAMPARQQISTAVDVPLSHASKRVLAYAAEEAESVSHEHIGLEHLLIALMRENTAAEIILREHGLTIKTVREKINKHPVKSTKAADVMNSQLLANQTIVQTLRETFAPAASRLSHETEPAVTFLFKAGNTA